MGIFPGCIGFLDSMPHDFLKRAEVSLESMGGVKWHSRHALSWGKKELK